MAESRGNLTERIIRVVETVVDAGGPIGPRGLARAAGIDRSAVGRILRRLDELEILERRSDGYVPGPRLFALGRVLSALDTLPDTVGPILGELVEKFNETCYFCALHGDVAVFTHEIQSTNPLRLVVELGKPVPLHAGAAGRAILAGLTEDEGARLLGSQPLPRVTPSTIVDVRELLEMAAKDRVRGYTVSIEERVPGGAAVAAPFFDHTGRCRGSVVFTAPLTRLDQDLVPEIGEAVVDAARSLSGRLGWTPDAENDPV